MTCRSIPSLAATLVLTIAVLSPASGAPLTQSAAVLDTTAPDQKRLESARDLWPGLNLTALRLSITHLRDRFGVHYPNGTKHLAELAAFETHTNGLANALARGDRAAVATVEALVRLREQALVTENPLVDFQRLLVIRRDASNLALPANYSGNSALGGAARVDNEIATLTLKDKQLSPLYRPARPVFVGDLCLHFNAGKLLFSSLAGTNRWQIFEINTDGSGLHQVSSDDGRDIDNFNGIYLPNGRILYSSTTALAGIPCLNGAGEVANLHLMDATGGNVRRLTFDQDHDWCPTLMPDGRVMYLRWEYEDIPHYFSRVLMLMNPDGTGQTTYYGSNSYWPNGVFYAKPIPGSPSKFAGIVTGHHGVARMGELFIFDVAKGRAEADGVVQRIPGRDKVAPTPIRDTLVDHSWPRFLHPVPLDDTYFIVSCKPAPHAPWGIYLTDTFDNLVPLAQIAGSALLEPVPFRTTEHPPVIPDKVNPAAREATCFIQDIYAGPGLRNVPRGTVKALRLFTYEYSYRGLGGHNRVAVEGCWDPRRILGTVPVCRDGSAHFTIPANVPVSIQPLDADGRALQLMRSWLVGMPGEHVSCTGCHENKNDAVTSKPALAATRPPTPITPWHGPLRGFNFLREVQPVLNRHCIGCHDGTLANRPDFAHTNLVVSGNASRFPASYLALHPYVRRNGIEGDYHLPPPLEFHARTSPLVQMLEKGHHGVKLDPEGWDRLNTWIDLNVPCHGAWSEVAALSAAAIQGRMEAKACYAGITNDNPEVNTTIAAYDTTFVMPAFVPRPPRTLTVKGWPFDADTARKMQAQVGDTTPTRELDLGDGLTMKLVRIPAGKFVLGDAAGTPDEVPRTVTIRRPFWIGETEVSLEQYNRFDTTHHNGTYNKRNKDHVDPGYDMNNPKFPAVRISCDEATGFCKWLAARTGTKVTLPSEAQWEWACRAGTANPFSYGGYDDDFSPFANMADRQLLHMAVAGVNPQVVHNAPSWMTFDPKDVRFNDGAVHLAAVDRYQPNAWGVKNMHGNAAEWTRSESDGTTLHVVRGGSWNDVPARCAAFTRRTYEPWQKVFDTGFRIIVED